MTLAIVGAFVIAYMAKAMSDGRRKSYEWWSWYEKARDIHKRLKDKRRYADDEEVKEGKEHAKRASWIFNTYWVSDRSARPRQETRGNVVWWAYFTSLFWPLGYISRGLSRFAVYATSPTKRARQEKQLEYEREQRDNHVANIDRLERDLKVGDYAESP